MKKCLSSLLPLALTLSLLAGCSGPGTRSAAEDVGPAQVQADDAPVTLDLSQSQTLPEGVEYADGVFTVRLAGTYSISGVSRDRLVVDADGPVELILSGVGLTGPKCLQLLSGDPVVLTAAEGSVNTLSDGGGTPDDYAGAVLYAKSPLTIGGQGALNVLAGLNNAIQCHDGLTVGGGTVTLRAAGAGIKVRGDLVLAGGSLDIESGGDGVAADAGRLSGGGVSLLGGGLTIRAGARGIDAEGAVCLGDGVWDGLPTVGQADITAVRDGIRAGSFVMDCGSLVLDAGEDGIQTADALYVRDGALSVTSGGGGGSAISHPGESFGPWAQSASAQDDASAKGLKSDGNITLSGGVIDLNTANDSIHCGGVFTMDGGSLTLLSSDDALHADDMLVINDGSVNIVDCFEGLEAFAVEVRGGDIVIRAVNDGINCNGPEMMFGGRSQDRDFQSVSGASVTYYLQTGGSVDLVVTGTMSNMGDGVDSNGAVYVTGGDLIVSTYGSFMENGIDTGWGGPVVTGGRVIAGGSSAMSEGFGESSTQCCAVVSTSYKPDGTPVTITDEDGNVIWSVVMADGFSCLQLSHPDLKEGHIYTVAMGEEVQTLDFTSTTNISRSRGFGRPF